MHRVVSVLVCTVLLLATASAMFVRPPTPPPARRDPLAEMQARAAAGAVRHAPLKMSRPDSAFAGLSDNAMSCTQCMELAALLGPAVRANLTLDVILDIGIPICTAAERKAGWPDCKEETCAVLCRGLITEESVDVLSVALDTVLAPDQFCAYVGVCPAPPPPPTPSAYIPVPSNVSDHTGEDVLRARFPAVWSRTSGAANFIHLTDIHVDLQYAPGSNSTCFMPICCRTEFGPGNATHSAGTYGDYNCDPPVSLVESLFAHIAALDPAPDFIVYTGDDPAHDIWAQSRAANLAVLDRVSALMTQYFPHIPVYSAIGNHAAYPVNQFEGPDGDFWLTQHTAADWAYYLTPNAQHTLAYGGYYTQRIRPGLRIIGLQTNYYMSENFWLVSNDTDTSCQLNWLASVLEQTERAGERAIIASHAVCNDWQTPFCERYGALVTRYRTTIVAMLHGHTHTTSYTLFYDNSTGTAEPSHVAFMPGSVTMIYGVNPTYRVCEYDRALPRPYLVDDFVQFWTDMAQPNTAPDWSTVRYRASAAYDLPDLSPASWRAFSDRLLTNATAYDAYVTNYARGAPMKGGAPGPRYLYCETISETDEQEHACGHAEPIDGELVLPPGSEPGPRPDFC